MTSSGRSSHLNWAKRQPTGQLMNVKRWFLRCQNLLFPSFSAVNETNDCTLLHIIVTSGHVCEGTIFTVALLRNERIEFKNKKEVKLFKTLQPGRIFLQNYFNPCRIRMTGQRCGKRNGADWGVILLSFSVSFSTNFIFNFLKKKDNYMENRKMFDLNLNKEAKKTCTLA